MEPDFMTENASFAVRIIKAPVRAAWFLIRNPLIALVIVALILFSSISFLALYNEAIANRFNDSMGFFFGATLASSASDALKARELKYKKASLALENRNAEISQKNRLIKKQSNAIAKKNQVLRATSIELKKSATALRGAGVTISQQGGLIRAHKSKISNFRRTGKAIERTASKRFSKVAIYDAAGELMGWLPVVGDAASIGLAAAGVYEMCQMFREIESATDQLGVKYQVYTDTFCEKPAEKTAEVVAEKIGQVKGQAVAMTTIFQERTSSLSLPDKDALIVQFQTMLDMAYQSFPNISE